jgi:hypothetical protein
MGTPPDSARHQLIDRSRMQSSPLHRDQAPPTMAAVNKNAITSRNKHNGRLYKDRMVWRMFQKNWIQRRVCWWYIDSSFLYHMLAPSSPQLYNQYHLSEALVQSYPSYQMYKLCLCPLHSISLPHTYLHLTAPVDASRACPYLITLPSPTGLDALQQIR